jgi:C-terminal processing protease CtpA/Prc
VNDDAPESALFDLLLGMAMNLNDTHTVLTADTLDREADAWASPYRHYDDLGELESNVESRYVDGRALKFAAEDEIAWGRIGGVGYLSITSMDEISKSGDEDDDRTAARAAMAGAMGELRASKGLIVDVRANEGGWDTVALEIARWVEGPRALAWSKQVRNGPKHTDLSVPEPTFVEASVPEAFAGPVVVLTSGGTCSAAETFVMAMKTRSAVTVLGEPTSGHFSDMWDARLPNGWLLEYSDELYAGADGKIYETKGMPADVLVPFDEAARTELRMNGKDIMLEAALDRLR